jgi:GGDEF domain-containing protein
MIASSVRLSTEPALFTTLPTAAPPGPASGAQAGGQVRLAEGKNRLAKRQPGEQRRDLVKRADLALYAAKEGGRKQVEVSPG